jgi:hypothetical protein
MSKHHPDAGRHFGMRVSLGPCPSGAGGPEPEESAAGPIEAIEQGEGQADTRTRGHDAATFRSYMTETEGRHITLQQQPCACD